MRAITDERVKSKIAGNQFYRFPDTTVTICLITLDNGYHVVGQSACVNPDDYDETTGRDIAFENAKAKVYDLEAYLEMEKWTNG